MIADFDSNHMKIDKSTENIAGFEGKNEVVFDVSSSINNNNNSNTIASNPEKLATAEKSLWYYNMTCCILHFFQALICLAAGLSVENLKKFKTPLNTVFTYWDKDYPDARLEESAQLPFVPVTSGFAWLSAVAHLIVLLNYPLYLSDLRKGINRFRWYILVFTFILYILIPIALYFILFILYT